jgi:DNA-binding MarR family transcriptional regulator
MTLGWQFARRRGTDLKALPTKILAVIKALKSANRNVALPNIVVFLCACENEGMTVKELAYVSGLSSTAVSRALRTLCDTECAPDAQSRACPGEPLMYLTRHLADGRRHVVCLTEAGRQLKDQVEFIFSDRDVMIGRRSLNEELAGHP